MMAITTGGTMATTPAALMKEKLMLKSDVNEATTMGMVCDARVWVNISASKNSFQLVRKVKRTTATRDGRASGRYTSVKVWKREQPSTRAALSRSSGSDSK